MKFSGSVGRFHGGAAGQGMGVQYCASLFSKLSAEGTLENPTTEWVPKVQSGVFSANLSGKSTETRFARFLSDAVFLVFYFSGRCRVTALF